MDGSATYLGLLAGLAVCPVGLIVQLLGDNTQELSLVFVAVVVRGADADQLARHDDKDEQLKKKKKDMQQNNPLGLFTSFSGETVPQIHDTLQMTRNS